MLQGWKMRDMNLRHRLARVEIARYENARNAIVWNTECCICLSIAEQECMSRQEKAPDFASCIPARQGGCTETARNSTRLPTESGYRGLRRGSRRCTTRSVRKRPCGVWVLVSLWPSRHETPEEDRSDGGIPERGNNASGIPLSSCTIPLLPVTDIDPEFQDVKVLVHDDTPSKTLLLQLCRYVERQWLNKSSIGAARMSVRGSG